MNKHLNRGMRMLLLAVLFLGSVEGLLAQSKKQEEAPAGGSAFKRMLVKKFDENKDGALAPFEQAKAAEFLRGMDSNGDGQISLTERNNAALALAKLSNTTSKTKGGATVATRNTPQRLLKWQEFSKKLPHGAGARVFTNKSMPGEPGFSVKGEAVIDITEKKADLNIPSQISNEDLDAKLAKRKADQKSEMAKGPVKREISQEALKASRKKRSYYDDTMILAKGDVHTVVPKGAIIGVPVRLQKLVVKEPVGKLMRWPDFLKEYARFVMIKEVSWETVTGKDPISKKEKKDFLTGSKVIVATFQGNPITVLDPPPEDGEKGAVVSSNGKKGK